MLQELIDLGFDRVELGHGVRLPLMEGIQRMVETGKVTISSLHNFCPLPIEITRASPDCYKFSAPEPKERERAVRFSCQTIDFAERLGAPFVVLHLGRTPIDDYTAKLVGMAEAGLIHSREFVAAKLECIRKREKESAPYFSRAKECLERVADYAGKHGVKLGIESRHSFEEIPNEREMIEVLEKFALPQIGYWHDFGHVQVKHNIGFLDHLQWLEQVASRLLGCHLHDTAWPGRDHMAPFCGTVEYDKLIPLLPRDMLYVFEMSPKRTREEIVTARDKWIATYGA